MIFLKVDDCLALDEARREFLREFDHRLRDVLVAAQHDAHILDAEDELIGLACLTVMMSVIASAALVASKRPADVTSESFSAIARDALEWAKRNAGRRGNPGATWLWSVFWPPASSLDSPGSGTHG
jgi:hypothetical protein